MELEEMQLLWTQMSDRLENQKQLTNKLIMEMTKDRFSNRIGIIAKYETMGTVICLAIVIFILAKFSELDTWYFLAGGIFVIAYMLIIPAYVLHTIKEMRRINLVRNNYAQTIVEYTRNRSKFLFAQRLAIYLNFLLALVTMPVAIKLFDGKNIFLTGDFKILYWYIPVMILFLIFFSRWGYGGYKKITASAGEILNELKGS